MKRYIEHLLEDLEGIRRNAPGNLASFFNVSDKQELDLYHVEDFSGVRLAELIGIEQVFFPNEDYLSDEEASKVVDELVTVYKSHGLNPLFEQCVSDRIKYGHLRHGLNQQVFPVYKQMVDIEMCDYLPEYCPLYELCSQLHNHPVCCEIKRRA